MTESYQESKVDYFKFKELKAYASTEYLAENQKKYRQVFEQHQISYVYAEITLFNKLFDYKDWELSGELYCYAFKGGGKRKICAINFQKRVSKYDSIIYIREGWGNKTVGAFWKPGTYCWEAWVEGKKVGVKHFYVESVGRKELMPGENIFLELSSVKMYEGPHDDVHIKDRVYLRQFSAHETRYIFVEVTFRNLIQHRSWQAEIFTKFYNGARELKGRVVKLQRINSKDDFITLTFGLGANAAGSWSVDTYTAEIIFMDRVIASIPFEVNTESELGQVGVLLPELQSPILLNEEVTIPYTFEELMNKLNQLIGLREIKQKVKDHAQYLRFLQLRKEKGFEEKAAINVHSVFIGNPGTGKTTVAKMMGKLYKKMGLLSKGHVYEVDRGDLVGEYIGQTAPKVKEAIEKARGGVMLIDEAYALARSNDDHKDFGREVIEILIKELSNGPGDLAVIAAGYPKEMTNFLNANPGLKSRFKFYFEFSDYLPQELSAIAEVAAVEKSVKISSEAKAKIDEMIVQAYRKRDRSFGNARYVYDLIEKAKINLGLRIMAMESPGDCDHEVLSTLILEDVEKIKLKEKRELPAIPIDEELLAESLDELNGLVGLEKVKLQINELVNLVKYYQESKQDVLNRFYLHTIFVGNPGTGKTTVARILAKIYKALGVLERGQIVETDRQGLVAGYVGQTATKTAEKVEEALGGVLFIDEAYALTMPSRGQSADFGEEAVQTLLKRMEDHRGTFFVFAAGYPDNMEQFLKTNPGLNSRFDKILEFEDYNPDELAQIALRAFAEKDFIIAPDAEQFLFEHLNYLYERRDRYFGNARTVRNIVEEIIKQQNLRLAAHTISQRSKEVPNLITLQDVQSIKETEQDSVFKKQHIGFRATG